MADKSPPPAAPKGEAQFPSKKDGEEQNLSTSKISGKQEPPPSEGQSQSPSTSGSKNSTDKNSSKNSKNSKEQHPPTSKVADKSHVQPPLGPESPESPKDGKNGKESHPSSREKLLSELSQHIQAAEAAASLASSIREQASSLPDASEEKAHLLEEAQKQEKIYAKEIKVANRLQSGIWQGGAAGAGMGAGVGAGVGTLVGSLVGGVVSIPTTGLGLLGGVATGAVHGPWVKMPKVPKLGGGDGEDVETEEEVSENGEGKD